MLSYSDIKNIEVHRNSGNNKQYFNKDDIKFFNTDKREIKAFQLYDQLLLIIDNCKFSNETERDYKIKLYDIKNERMSTLFISKNKKLILDIFETLQYLKAFTDSEIDILMTCDLRIENNQLFADSGYFKKSMRLI